PEGVQSNWGDAPGLFASGEAAMIVHSTGSLPSVVQNADFEFGVSGLPGREGGFHTVTGGGNLYLMSDVDEATAQQAADFVAWLTSPELSADWSIRTGYIATRMSALETEARQA